MFLEKNLIGGNWTGGANGLEILNPSDLSDSIATYGLATKADVEAAFAAARKAQPAEVLAVIAANTEGSTFGVLGEPRVNVLAVNLALDARWPQPQR